MSRLSIKRINNEIKRLTKDTNPYFTARPMKDDIFQWYYVLHNLDSDHYKDGVYLGKIQLPPEYPMKAPRVYMYTPNGRLSTKGDICTTFTSYHNSEWTTNWNVQGMIMGLISFIMDDTEHGIGSIKYTKEERQKLAKRSMEYNREHFKEIFEEYFPHLLEETTDS